MKGPCFLNNTNGLYLLAFDINADGTLRNRRNFAVYEGRSKRPNDLPGIVTGADGLIIDSEGRLYALTAAGVEIFSPQGKHLGVHRHVVQRSRLPRPCLQWSEEKHLICRRSWRSLGN